MNTTLPLKFEPITSNSMEKIMEFAPLLTGRFCDLTPGALFMWTELFDNKYCIDDDTLFVSGLDLNGQTSFCVPVCRSAESEKAALSRLYSYAIDTVGYLKLYPIGENSLMHYKELLGEISCGGTVEETLMEDWFDYIYWADDLLELTGKKYHGQRNHINRFKRENSVYSFELIKKHNLAEALSLASRLSLAEDGGRVEVYERLAAAKLLNNLDEAGQTGFLLRVAEKPAGYIVGEVIGDTLYEHVEKADKQYAGIFPFMMNMYLKAMKERHSEIKYVNREEDLGDLGIRYSKECYHPLYKNFKYYIMVK